MHIWQFSDGRAGHERQVTALLDAMQRRASVTVDELAPMSALAAMRAVVQKRLRQDLADPQLVVGAGHRTHAALLAAARIRGARSVVLMRPSLPLSLFDLCIVPRHDRPPARVNVIETVGALSPLRPADERGTDGLILVGGPSRHYYWTDADVWRQIRALVDAAPGRRWRLSTSRRTPATFLRNAPGDLRDRLEIQTPGRQPPGWLDRTLPRCGSCWVTPDSLAMISDALNAGVPCGVLDLPARRRSRVARAVERLVGEGRLARFDPDAPSAEPPESAPLLEADRVAEMVLDRWRP